MFIPNPKDYQVSGADQYSFDLKNGWVLVHEAENYPDPLYGCPTADAPVNGGFLNSKPPGVSPSSSTVQVMWKAGCSIQYAVALHITGPIGVPWR
jgi:hypothetical protein